MTFTHVSTGGLRLAYTVFGPADGESILAQHGLIASIEDGALFDSLVTAGRRVICVARPGYGRSAPHRLTYMAQWGAIVARLAESLSLHHYDVLGMSSGAPYAYAIGHADPARVRNLYIFSGTPALYDDDLLAQWPFPSNREAGFEDLQALAHDLFFAGLSDEDRRRLDIRDSMANNGFGIAQDFYLRVRDWGFKLPELYMPVYMEHSRDDENVPLITAEMTATMLPDCRLSVRDGEHFSPSALARFFETTVLAVS